jgi:cation transport regulator
MPYANLDDLPKNIKHALPAHAQEIYRSAFNQAHKTYAREDESEEDLDFLCYKIAWAAVKHKYHKNQKGKWTEILKQFDKQEG